MANGVAEYLGHCDLWNPNALGPGRGWFDNMWVHTMAGKPTKTREGAGCYDFGWGEGEAIYHWLGAISHWKRTGDASLLPHIDEMTKNMEFFRRGRGGGKGDRNLLCEAPEGPFRQKVPVPFSAPDTLLF